MVIIDLLELKNNIAHIRCFPENKKNESFEMVLDLKNRRIIGMSIPENTAYSGHAAYRAFEFFKEEGTLPEHFEAVWY